MRRNNAGASLALVLATVVLAAVGCNTGGEARGRKAVLELQGAPGTEFSGSCAVGDEEPEEVSGQVPQSFIYRLNGRNLDCKISSDGDVEVALTVGKNARSVQRTSGGTLNLTYDNGSISSSLSSAGSSSSDPSRQGRQGISSPSRGATTSESRNVSGFDEVELNGVGNLSIQQTGSESLTVEAEADVVSKLATEVEYNRLIIGPKPGTSIHSTEPINYRLTVKGLNSLKVSGSGNVDAEGIRTDELAVTVSGAGSAKTSGRADSQNIDISGSGGYRAVALQSKEAKIYVGGSGSAIVNVSDELDAEVSGSGYVEYVGEPTVNQEVSGAGRVSKHRLPKNP